MIDHKRYIEDIMGRGIQFYDYQKLDQQAWVNYFQDAEQIVKNETFNNELTHYIADLVKFAATESQSWEQVLNTRTAIITLETFKQRLESIEDPRKDKTTENIHEAI